MKTIPERMNPRQQLSETYERNGLHDEDHSRDILMAAKLRPRNLELSDERNAGPREER